MCGACTPHPPTVGGGFWPQLQGGSLRVPWGLGGAGHLCLGPGQPAQCICHPPRCHVQSHERGHFPSQLPPHPTHWTHILCLDRGTGEGAWSHGGLGSDPGSPAEAIGNCAGLQPALATLTTGPPAGSPSEEPSTAQLLSCGRPRAEALQHGARLPPGRQVPHVRLQPALLAGRLRHPRRWHLAGCHPGELRYPVLLLPVPVGCQPAYRYRDLCHGHRLRGLHWRHQGAQVPLAHFLCDAVAGAPAGGHRHCPVLRLH